MGPSSSNGFDQRKKAFEAKYLHDDELNFRVHAKRNRLFGLYAAELLGYKGKKAEQYVDAVILADIQKTQGEGVLRKVLKDLISAEVEISEHRLQKELERCWEMARDIIMSEKESSS